jgi:hypothetical protein
MMTLSEFLMDLSQVLGEQNQKFLVARNYEALPQSNNSADIDLIISPKSVLIWRQCIEKIAKNNNLVVDRASQYYYCRQFAVFGLDDGPIRFDLIPFFLWRGVKWHDSEKVIDRAEIFRDFVYRPTSADEAFITFCHSYLYGGFVKEKYLSKLQGVIKSDRIEVSRLSNEIFGESITCQILDEIVSGDLRSLNNLARRRRLFAFNKNLCRKPFRHLLNLSIDMVYEKSINRKERLVSERSRRVQQ